ncbi:protein VACUOLELESS GAMETOPHYTES-like [Musa acuminata AAA Group]|uniref:protein VACUOLELESS GAMETOPHYTES-like n=1 Tax=Musa acuminata AAA Group TaxID=214697 RepID=UPI0031E17375
MEESPRHVTHFLHPDHPLVYQYHEASFVCSGCRITGDGLRYRCDRCNFELHEHCARCPSTISFHMHPQHLLTLHARPGTARLCDVCGVHVGGMVYQCRTCGFDLHPLCSLVRPQPARGRRANRGGGWSGIFRSVALTLFMDDVDDYVDDNDDDDDAGNPNE